MRETLKFGLLRGVTIAALGLVIGIVAGLVSLTTGELFAAAALTGQIYLAHLVLVPAWMILLTVVDTSDEDSRYYLSLSGALSALLPAALIGSVGATLLFMAASAQLETIFGAFDGAVLRQEILAHMGLLNPAVLVAITLLVAIGLSFWGNQKAESASTA